MNDAPGSLLAPIARRWDDEIVPQLTEYIRVPAKSPHFDADWKKSGHIDAVVALAEKWARRQPIRGLTLEVVRLDGRTPLLFFDAPANGAASQRTVALYGHLDKQPEMSGWRAGLGPWTPVYENGRLYGRGGADDGYAIFAALAAIGVLDAEGCPRPRCVGLIETCEESGSYDLPAYLEALAPRMGEVALVIALDSGAGNYDQLWATTSLRGIVNGTLSVEILEEGVHSGDAGGVVPSSFRIARALLDRIDSVASGRIEAAAFNCRIPAERRDQARHAAGILGDTVSRRFPFVAGAKAVAGGEEGILNRTWRPALEVIGAEGLPPLKGAGNVLRPFTKLELSLRLPPLVEANGAAAALKRSLEADPPYGARVSFEYDHVATGWNAPSVAPWLAEAFDSASQALFGQPAAYLGEGGTIPFMGMLGAKFPRAQILVTGVLGPKSNAHGPNEFIDVPYAKKLTAAVATVVAACP
jgi:acetylornithine deacetylase/succinyl-diaminopimelate desuccinylase-like protein